MDQWQRQQIFDELKEYKHNIEVFNPLNFDNFDIANEEFIKSFKTKKILPDLFMTCVSSKQIFIETIKHVKCLGIPTLLICFDNLHAPFMHKKIAPLFDLVWLTSNETKYLFDKWGCKTIFQPYAANPFQFQIKPGKEIRSIGFIGTPYGTRTNKINQLTQHSLLCHVYSNTGNLKDKSITDYQQLLKAFYNLSRFSIGRKVLLGALMNKITKRTDTELEKNNYLSQFPSVSFVEMNHLYSNLAISLGITELRNTYTLKNPVHKLHLRTFEIPMCGGLQLSSYTNGLAGYFENDKEIILYQNNDEMISKAKFYLKPKNERLRMRIKIAARKRAEGEHTWMNRFNNIFKYLNS